MIQLLEPQRIVVSPRRKRVVTRSVRVNPLTALLEVWLQRPCYTHNLAWNGGGTMRVTLVLSVDDVIYRSVGQVTGGVRPGPPGREADVYIRRYAPTWGLFDEGRLYAQQAPIGEDGYIHDVPRYRLGQTGRKVEAWLEFEHLDGRIETVLEHASVWAAPLSPLRTYHNSVAVDNTTTDEESNGDGVRSFSHLATGSNLAAFFAVINGHTTPKAGSATYNAAAMTELWDAQPSGGAIVRNAGYIKTVSSGTQTVESTLTGVTWDHILGVTTFTGVDQTTPNGNQQTNEPLAATSTTVTCTGVAEDDFVIDAIAMESGTPTPTVGANQSVTGENGWQITGAFNGTVASVSTQDGFDGGAMSWSWAGSFSGYHAAVVIEAAAGAPPPPTDIFYVGVMG